MAGFLRQLAEQVLRPGTDLHPAAAVPFAGERPRDAAGEDPLPWPTDPRAEVDVGTPPMRRTSGPMPAASTRESHDPAVATPPQRRRPASASPEDAQTSSAPDAQAETAPASLGRRRVVTVEAATIFLRGDPAPAHRHGPATPGAATAGEENPPRTQGHVHPAADDRVPVQITGLVPSRSRTTALSHAAESSRTSAAAPVVPDVHIHIGRIELTAAAPTPGPATRRDSGARRKPMSLDAYLQQRRGKSP